MSLTNAPVLPGTGLETPAERRRRETRDAILLAAERVFARDGEEGLSIRRLADEVDYSPAAIYKYFRSKDDLIQELKNAFFEKLMANMNLSLEESRPFSGLCRNCVLTYILTALDRPHHYAAAFAGVNTEDGDEDGHGQDDSPAVLAYDMLSEMVSSGIEEGSFRQDLDVDVVAKSLWASMHGLVMLMIHYPEFPAKGPGDVSVSRDEFMRFHADLIIRGLEK